MKLTKRQVLLELKEMFKNMPETKGDSVMKREIFNNYTDQLCKDGLISNYQYDSWTNPF